ncbi:uncharacterized protein [Danio rerio]|uniref:Uncharacterized protein n=1 Tax=Danio rerio TaxID=7955 RepID=A0AC58G8K1_DANRE
MDNSQWCIAIYCLKCLTIQEDLTGHLRQVCMSGAEEALVLEEVARAEESRAGFVREGRVIDLAEVRGLVQEDPTGGSLAEHLRAKGFLVVEQQKPFSKSPYPSSKVTNMAEVGRCLIQQCELPLRTQTEFRSFCVATLVWRHRLGPGSVKELKVRQEAARAAPYHHRSTFSSSCTCSTACSSSRCLRLIIGGLFRISFPLA